MLSVASSSAQRNTRSDPPPHRGRRARQCWNSLALVLVSPAIFGSLQFFSIILRRDPAHSAKPTLLQVSQMTQTFIHFSRTCRFPNAQRPKPQAYRPLRIGLRVRHSRNPPKPNQKAVQQRSTKTHRTFIQHSNIQASNMEPNVCPNHYQNQFIFQWVV